MEPDTFFLTYRRDVDEDRFYAAVGRALAFATRFEWNCRALAKLAAIRENPMILVASREEEANFFQALEGTLAKQIRKIAPKFVHLQLADETVFNRAREARNTLAHEAALGVEYDVTEPFARERLLTTLRELTRDIAAADALVCVGIAVANDEPILARLDEYADDIAKWVVQGAT